jgi:hypothetical protein
VHDYREAHGIHEEIRAIDWSGVFWQRAESVAYDVVAARVIVGPCGFDISTSPLEKSMVMLPLSRE